MVLVVHVLLKPVHRNVVVGFWGSLLLEYPEVEKASGQVAAKESQAVKVTKKVGEGGF